MQGTYTLVPGPNLPELHLHRGNKVCRVPIRYFRVVQLQRTSSNLLEPLQYRESKVCRSLSHEFWVVRRCGTFPNRIFTVGTGCVGYLCATCRWFNSSEPPRTFSNHFSAEKARCVEHEFGVVRLYRTCRENKVCRYLYTSSGWFNRSEPPQTISNHFSAEKVRCIEVSRMSSEWFDYTEPSRTASSQGE